MKLTPPSQAVFFISVAVAILGLLLFLGTFTIGVEAFWIMTIAFVLLALGNMLEDM